MSTPASILIPAERPSRSRWSDEDMAIMREHWPNLGTVKVQQMLSLWRSESCIRMKAKRMGLVRAKRRAPYQCYVQSDLVDHQILQAYATGKPGEIKSLSQRLGRNYGWIRWRAVHLGCRPMRLKEPDWCAEELAILARMEGIGPYSAQRALKRAGYVRGINAVYERMRRKMHLDLHEDGQMTLNSVAIALHVDHKVVGRWADKHGLKTSKRMSYDGNTHPARWVSRAELRRFIRDNPVLVDIRKADKFWLIDLLTECGK